MLVVVCQDVSFMDRAYACARVASDFVFNSGVDPDYAVVWTGAPPDVACVARVLWERNRAGAVPLDKDDFDEKFERWSELYEGVYAPMFLRDGGVYGYERDPLVVTDPYGVPGNIRDYLHRFHGGKLIDYEHSVFRGTDGLLSVLREVFAWTELVDEEARSRRWRAIRKKARLSKWAEAAAGYERRRGGGGAVGEPVVLGETGVSVCGGEDSKPAAVPDDGRVPSAKRAKTEDDE